MQTVHMVDAVENELFSLYFLHLWLHVHCVYLHTQETYPPQLSLTEPVYVRARSLALTVLQRWCCLNKKTDMNIFSCCIKGNLFCPSSQTTPRFDRTPSLPRLVSPSCTPSGFQVFSPCCIAASLQALPFERSTNLEDDRG